MIISNPTLSTQDGRSKVEARVDWEECDIPSSIAFFDVPAGYLPKLEAVNGAFLVAAALPALHRNEKRIKLDGAVDPSLRNNLESVLAQHSHWFGYPRRRLHLEVSEAVTVAGSIPNRAASFFSGGVDSLWTIRRNMLTLPKSHPHRIRDGVIAYGFDMGISGESDRELFGLTLTHLESVAEAAGIKLVPVYTNIRSLLVDSNFWAARWHGMVLAAVGQVLSGKVTDIFVPSTNDLWHPAPWGSSPLIEPNLSTINLRVFHDGTDQTRLDKMRLLADWPVAVDNLRVCTKVDQIPNGQLNCGVCEKCLRTKLELLACNALEKSTAFDSKLIPVNLVERISLLTSYQASEYEELVSPLFEAGHASLATSVEAVVQRWEMYSMWRNEEDWKGLIKQFVRRIRGGQPARNEGAFPVRDQYH